MKRTVILAIILGWAIVAFSTPRSFSDRTKTWLQSQNTENAEETDKSGDLRIGDAPPEPLLPVGEGLFVISVLAGLYGVRCRRKNNK